MAGLTVDWRPIIGPEFVTSKVCVFMIHTQEKAHLEEALSKSENLHFAANAKYETECQTVATLQKKIKDLQSRVEEVEDLIEQERNTKGKIERQRDDLRRELEELNERLEEAGGATNAQIELNKRREAEMTRLRRDLADANLAHDLQVMDDRNAQKA